MWCLCGSPDCHSCGPAQGWHVHTRDCAGEDGIYECGGLTYDAACAMEECERCGELSNTSICSVCQRRMEEDSNEED